MMLSVSSLSVRYGTVLAVNGLTLEVGRGEVVALLGANGAGKSSALKALMSLVTHSAGAMLVDGQEVGSADTRGRLRAGLSLSPEGRHVFPQLTVRENMDLGYTGKGAVTTDQCREAMYKLFPRLREREWQEAGSLSGGEQQMLAIARAVMAQPRVLMLDEPTLGLAPIVIRELMRAIRHFREQGVSVLLAEQNAAVALSVADRGYVLQNGKVIAQDSADVLKSSEQVRVAFLGL